MLVPPYSAYPNSPFPSSLDAALLAQSSKCNIKGSRPSIDAATEKPRSELRLPNLLAKKYMRTCGLHKMGGYHHKHNGS